MDVSFSFDGDLDYGPEPDWLKSIAPKILSLAKAPANAEVGLLIAANTTMQAINLEWRMEDRPTDVLAFAMRETPKGEKHEFVLPPDRKSHLGEVIISYPQAEVQAKEHGHSVNRELAILLIHGVLHLLGEDHGTSAKAKKMQAKEAEILEALKSEAK